ncbi:MAG TPA: hypothetical protein VNC50_00320, partial [Planctomycetia bacterium]|nr:hypothetical protein [Planctomycetia bacterium]
AERGDEATVDGLREAVNDPALDDEIVRLAMEAPGEDDAYAEGLAEIRRALARDRNRTLTASAQRSLSESKEEQDHLEVVRRLLSSSEAQEP